MEMLLERNLYHNQNKFNLQRLVRGKNSSYYQTENKEFSQINSKFNYNPKYDDCFFRQLYIELLSLDHRSSVSHQYWAKTP